MLRDSLLSLLVIICNYCVSQRAVAHAVATPRTVVKVALQNSDGITPLPPRGELGPSVCTSLNFLPRPITLH